MQQPGDRRWRRQRTAAACSLAAVAAATAALVAGALDAPGASGASGWHPGRGQWRKALPGRLTIAWGGDTTLGSVYGLPPDRGRPLLRAVAPQLRGADLAAVNYEGAFATGTSTKCPSVSRTGTCFAFGAPPANAASLRHAGIDVVNLANNHANDYGDRGRARTQAALRGARVGFTGAPGRILRRRVRGAIVALLGFAPYPWAGSLLDLAGARAVVRRAARTADLVVVFLHAGAEGSNRAHTPAGPETYLGEPRGNARAFAHAVVDAGADVVLGSGPHVLRGIERYRGRLIAYSLGNLAGFHTFGTSGALALSGVLSVTVDRRGRFAGGRFASLRFDGAGIPHADPSGAAARFVSSTGRADFGDRAVVVSNGQLTGSS
jgi:capsule synthesis protein PGA_cap